MRRRAFITLLGGAAAWPLAARAQQGERMGRIGVLTSYDESDPEAKAYLSEFMKVLGELDWTDGRNVRMDVRWAGGSVDRARMYAKELVGELAHRYELVRGELAEITRLTQALGVPSARAMEKLFAASG